MQPFGVVVGWGLHGCDEQTRRRQARTKRGQWEHGGLRPSMSRPARIGKGTPRKLSATATGNLTNFVTVGVGGSCSEAPSASWICSLLTHKCPNPMWWYGQRSKSNSQASKTPSTGYARNSGRAIYCAPPQLRRMHKAPLFRDESGDELAAQDFTAPKAQSSLQKFVIWAKLQWALRW